MSLVVHSVLSNNMLIFASIRVLFMADPMVKRVVVGLAVVAMEGVAMEAAAAVQGANDLDCRTKESLKSRNSARRALLFCFTS